jgi:acyl dehydratase
VTRSFIDVATGDTLPERGRIVTAADVKAYADASGDQNPLHQDEGFARSVGFDGIIAHGMFTMGFLAACVVAWAGNDPSAVVALNAQFRAPVSIGEEIRVRGRVRALDPQARTVTLELSVTVDRDGETVDAIKRAEAVVRLV